MLHLFTSYRKLLICLGLLSSPCKLQASQKPTGYKYAITSTAQNAGTLLAVGVGTMAHRSGIANSHKKDAHDLQQQSGSLVAQHPNEQCEDYAHDKCKVSNIPAYEELEDDEKHSLQQEVFDIHKRCTSDKPLVLFFGDVGGGKSTIIKYLLGANLSYEDGAIGDDNEDKSMIEQPGTILSSSIDHSLCLEAQSVHFYDQDTLGLTFADAEGLLSRREQATRVDGIMAAYTPYFALLTNTLQGIVMVVGSEALLNPSHTSILYLASRIIQYFDKHDLSTINKSFTMMVTHMENVKKKVVKKHIKTTIQAVYKKYFNPKQEKINYDAYTADVSTMKAFFDMFLQKPVQKKDINTLTAYKLNHRVICSRVFKKRDRRKFSVKKNYRAYSSYHARRSQGKYVLDKAFRVYLLHKIQMLQPIPKESMQREDASTSCIVQVVREYAHTVLGILAEKELLDMAGVQIDNNQQKDFRIAEATQAEEKTYRQQEKNLRDEKNHLDHDTTLVPLRPSIIFRHHNPIADLYYGSAAQRSGLDVVLGGQVGVADHAGGLVGTIDAYGLSYTLGALVDAALHSTEYIVDGYVNKNFYYNQQEIVCKVKFQATNGTFRIIRPKDKVLKEFFTYTTKTNSCLVLEAKPGKDCQEAWKITYSTDYGKPADVKIDFYARKCQTLATRNKIKKINELLQSLDNLLQKKIDNTLQLAEKCTIEHWKTLHSFLQHIILPSHSERGTIEQAYTKLGLYLANNQANPNYILQRAQVDPEEKKDE